MKRSNCAGPCTCSLVGRNRITLVIKDGGFFFYKEIPLWSIQFSGRKGSSTKMFQTFACSSGVVMDQSLLSWEQCRGRES